MCKFLHTTCLCWMYINSGQTLDFWCSVKETGTLPTCHQLYLLESSGPIKNCNIIELTPKPTPFEAFDDIHKVVLDGISHDMDSLVQSGMYGAINTDETTTHRFYVIQLIPEAYMLKNNTTIDGCW